MRTSLYGYKKTQQADGSFVCIYPSSELGSVYVYQFPKAVGCGNVKSFAHKKLPGVSRGHVMGLPVPPHQRRGICSIYYDGEQWKYTIEDIKTKKEVAMIKMEDVSI